MTSISSILTLLAISVTVLAVLAIAVTVLRSNYLRTSVQLLRETNADQADRIKELEGDIGRKDEKLARLESEASALARVVTGRDLLESLATQLATHHATSLARMTDLEEAILGRLDDVKGIIGARRIREQQDGRRPESGESS